MQFCCLMKLRYNSNLIPLLPSLFSFSCCSIVDFSFLYLQGLFGQRSSERSTSSDRYANVDTVQTKRRNKKKKREEKKKAEEKKEINNSMRTKTRAAIEVSLWSLLFFYSGFAAIPYGKV